MASQAEPAAWSSRASLQPGTYYLALTFGDHAARYQIRIFVRDVTTTSVTASNMASLIVRPGSTIPLRAVTSPAPGGGTTRMQADFFNVATGTWVFRKSWDVVPGSTIAFKPAAVGAWRVRATFRGSHTAGPSRSDYARIVVASV